MSGKDDPQISVDEHNLKLKEIQNFVAVSVTIWTDEWLDQKSSENLIKDLDGIKSREIEFLKIYWETYSSITDPVLQERANNMRKKLEEDCDQLVVKIKTHIIAAILREQESATTEKINQQKHQEKTLSIEIEVDQGTENVATQIPQTEAELSKCQKRMDTLLKLTQQQTGRWSEEFLSNLSITELQTLLVRVQGQELEFLKRYWASHHQIKDSKKLVEIERRMEFEKLAEVAKTRIQTQVGLKLTETMTKEGIEYDEIRQQLTEQTQHLSEAVQDIRELVIKMKISSQYFQPPLETERRTLLAERAGLSEVSNPFTKSKEIYRIQCPLCQEKHPLSQCRKFRAMERIHRKKMVNRRKLCFKCLLPHMFRECREQGCQACNREHHVLICPRKPDLAKLLEDKERDSLASRN